MAVFTYYAAYIRIKNKSFYYFIDFPNDQIETDDLYTVRDHLKKLVMDYISHFRVAPVATGIAPMIYKVKKWLSEQGHNPNTCFLTYQPVRIQIDLDGSKQETYSFVEQ